MLAWRCTIGAVRSCACSMAHLLVHEAVNEFRGLLVAELRSVSFVWVLRILARPRCGGNPERLKKKKKKEDMPELL